MFKFLGAMSARIFLITVIGVLVTAIIVNFFGQRDFRANESRMREQFAFERIENIIRILDATLPEKRNEIQDVFSRMGSKVVLNAPPPTNNPSLPAELAGLNVLLVPSVADQISTSKDCHPDRPPLPPGEHRPPEALMRLGLFSPFHEMERPKLHHQCLAVYTHLEDSTPVLIHLHFGRRPPLGRPGQDQPLSLMVLFVGLIAITWIVASISTKPLRKMADAALQLAKNIEHPPLAENEGPIEVRNAARAFNVMQRSILKHVEERAFILGAIAHDLQTPLTRLRLRLEKVKDTGLKQQLIDDLTATQEMVKEGLDFARLCSEDIHKTRVDLTALANAVCEDFIEMGHSVKTTLPSEPLYIMGSIHLLKRCLNNLLANAISYAKDPCLQLEQRDSTIYCIISDDGPGIPGNELDSILEPFRRLEDSRSRQTGGTGLGMTIARMIIEKHGGRVSLSNKKSPLTGLIVTIELPH